MTKSVNFIYSMVIFISLFMVAMQTQRIYQCIKESDCPQYMCSAGLRANCVDRGVCKCVPVWWRKFHVLT
ncbi:putative Late nodulin [Medicago truncatula]|uniref:Nodule Cysteine-Rich (NCR) secreted peptide n=1 Tax=Medicago truncatula TaxID=3880 RepID=A0A072UT45_MEDTR|nr:Nodule Cysteine-Rich (NCR) secreted peptide [Medicago truncatula]RHN65267.1 putative Late nodulin [Medicago truncatula]